MKLITRLAVVGCLVILAIFGTSKMMETKNKNNVEISSNNVITITNENFASAEDSITELENEIIQEQLDEVERSLPTVSKEAELNSLTTAAGEDMLVNESLEVEAVSATAQAIQEVVAPKPDIGFDMESATKEKILGNKDAKVTIIEYASLTCSHCASFHKKVYPDLKRDYIDTGKVKYILRDFPLDGIALKASMMARCIDDEKYFNIMEVLFKSQFKWHGSQDPIQSLKQTSKLAGLSSESFDKCIANKDLEKSILDKMQAGQKKWEIKATPSFIFNDGADKFTGEQPYREFQNTIDRLLKK